MKRLLSAVSCAAALVLAVACSPRESKAAEAVAIPYGANKEAGATFVHDGVTLYYETYGQGDPLLLVHGNGGSVGTLAAQIDHFKAKYRVIRHNGQAYSAGVRVFGQNGSASNGADFNIDAAGILASWGNGVDGALAKNVAILDDALAEGNESFSLVLGNFGTVLPGVVTTLTVNIIDDDSNDLIFANGFDPGRFLHDPSWA